MLLMALAGWINQHQLKIIEYQQEEIRVFRELHGKRRLRFNDEQRCRLAAKGKLLGRKLLREFATIVKPDTILRWHRTLIARKWDYSSKHRFGRPRIANKVQQLVVQFALENRWWGYSKLQGAMEHIGHKMSRETIANILRENGIDPAPKRSKGMTWNEFFKAHWDTMAATDFFTVEVWGRRGLVTYYVLVFMDLSTRKVYLGGITANPNTAWMMQMAKNVTDVFGGFLLGKRFLIMDRDSKYCEAFRHILSTSGIEPIRLPPRSPNLNAYMERFVKSIKYECTDRLVLIGERSLYRAVDQYLEFYNGERFHQGMSNRLLTELKMPMDNSDPIECRQRLGGMLKYYSRQAA